MIPAVIAVALLVLLFGLRAAADAEEERAPPADAEARRGRPRWREFTPALSYVVLLPVGFVIGTGGAILMAGDGPVWWWLWLAGAVIYAALLMARNPAE
jgi:hypothetical protein